MYQTIWSIMKLPRTSLYRSILTSRRSNVDGGTLTVKIRIPSQRSRNQSQTSRKGLFTGGSRHHRPHRFPILNSLRILRSQMVNWSLSPQTVDGGLYGQITVRPIKHGRRGDVPQGRCRNDLLHPRHHRSCRHKFHEVPTTLRGQELIFSTVMFVSASAFYTQIADPVIGGTYLTLLNTVSNLGGTWPRYFVLRGVDFFTQAACILPETSELESIPPLQDVVLT